MTSLQNGSEERQSWKVIIIFLQKSCWWNRIILTLLVYWTVHMQQCIIKCQILTSCRQSMSHFITEKFHPLFFHKLLVKIYVTLTYTQHTIHNYSYIPYMIYRSQIHNTWYITTIIYYIWYIGHKYDTSIVSTKN